MRYNENINSGAIALGPITIGDGARVGSSSVVIKSVPPGVTIVGIPGRVITKGEKPAMDLEHGRLPDPVAEAIRTVMKDQHHLGERLKRLEKAAGITEFPHKVKETWDSIKVQPRGESKRWSNDD
jgi:serine O-acetyltransferase